MTTSSTTTDSTARMYRSEGSGIVSDAGGHRIAGSDATLTPDSRYVVAVEPDVVVGVMNLLQG